MISKNSIMWYDRDIAVPIGSTEGITLTGAIFQHSSRGNCNVYGTLLIVVIKSKCVTYLTDSKHIPAETEIHNRSPVTFRQLDPEIHIIFYPSPWGI